MNFWEVIKEVSARSVRDEAARLFVLGLAGDPGPVAAARREVIGPDPAVAARADPYLCCASPPYPDEVEKRLRYTDLLVSLPGGPGLTDLRPADTLILERPDRVVPEVLARRPDLRVGLSRRFPGFRQQAAEQVIRDVSRVNAEFATIAGLSTALPVLAPLFPAVAGADLLVLTKNQVLMVYRLAAIYDESLDLRSRAREALAVVGGAFGWRTLARELLGALPSGMGLPVRAGIAYTGTYAVGRAAQIVYDEGRRPTRREMLRIYDEGRSLAAGVVSGLRDRLRKPKPLPPGNHAPDANPQPPTPNPQPPNGI